MTKTKNLVNQLFTRFLSAQDWIRTSTWFPTLRPEHSASTNFATWAFTNRKSANRSFFSFGGANIGKDKVGTKKRNFFLSLRPRSRPQPPLLPADQQNPHDDQPRPDHLLGKNR